MTIAKKVCRQFRNLINPQENQPHSAFEKRIPRGQPGGWCPFDMGTTQGQRTPDSVGEVAACPRDMCCMSTASGGSTSRPTAAPSASGRLKSPLWCGHRAESWSATSASVRPESLPHESGGARSLPWEPLALDGEPESHSSFVFWFRLFTLVRCVCESRERGAGILNTLNLTSFHKTLHHNLHLSRSF